jgi:beta-1,2-mannobiose phosphorylase / 1,2-beta-oligomannan phosphorylase
MITLQRDPNNPILEPNPEHEWEKEGAFNGCVAFANGKYHMVYRAFSAPKQQNGTNMNVSTVGYAVSDDGIHFKDQRQLFGPTEDWESYGCEDPRITYMDGKFYIFYTALSVYPFAAYGIRLAVAVTTDFKTFEKHPVTTFNSKAMGLFPEKINGKMAALLTMHTDLPPAKIALALFDREEDIWSPYFWAEWYDNPNTHIIHLLRDVRDQVELGAPPIKTEEGWLVIYSYIKNYISNDKSFGIEAVLLDLENPNKIVGRTEFPLISPEKDYELKGIVPNVIFPSGALVNDGKLFVYYGAADTRVAVASCDLKELLKEMTGKKSFSEHTVDSNSRKFSRFEGNPILKPSLELDWQKKGAFNPAAIYEAGKVHIVYRGQSEDGTSVFGYATSSDGIHIDEHYHSPIYIPREDFEKPTHSGNSGCEDPRITKIDDRFYMTYTAYDGTNPPRVALTSITVKNFLEKKWNWERPKLISPPGVDDKDACIIKRKNGVGYVAFHRLGDVIWLDFLRDLDFPEKKYLSGGIIAQARKDKWDNVKIGLSCPPIETDAGWILLYHGVEKPGNIYKVGAMLLDYEDPRKIIGRTDEPLLEPETQYEKEGQVPNVVFPCGAVVIENTIYLYYGGADTVTGVATMSLPTLLDLLLGR